LLLQTYGCKTVILFARVLLFFQRLWGYPWVFTISKIFNYRHRETSPPLLPLQKPPPPVSPPSRSWDSGYGGHLQLPPRQIDDRIRFVPYFIHPFCRLKLHSTPPLTLLFFVSPPYSRPPPIKPIPSTPPPCPLPPSYLRMTASQNLCVFGHRHALARNNPLSPHYLFRKPEAVPPLLLRTHNTLVFIS